MVTEKNLETEFNHGGKALAVIYDLDPRGGIRNVRIYTSGNDAVDRPSLSLRQSAVEAAARHAVDRRHGVAA